MASSKIHKSHRIRPLAAFVWGMSDSWLGLEPGKGIANLLPLRQRFKGAFTDTRNRQKSNTQTLGGPYE